jgi:NADH-quinone oxidoreductase subunit N
MGELNINFLCIAPQLVLISFGFLLMLIGGYTKVSKGGYLGQVSALGMAIAFIVNAYLFGSRKLGFSNIIIYDELAGIFNAIFISSGFLVSLLSDKYIENKTKHSGEYFALINFAVAGMTFMVASLDFLVLFLGLELMSLSVYILAGLFKHSEKSVESAMKYFLLGSFSTAIFLLGVAFLYGSFGTTNMAYMLQNYAKYFMEGKSLPLLVGSSLVFAGIVFKIAAVPFHMWTPDVYEGAPTTVTAFMATAVKAAAFSMLFRVYLLGLRGVVVDYAGIVAYLAVFTMTLGNLSALAQKSVKRMLAYSSIAHAGYLLVGFTALNQIGLGAVIFYLISYMFMNIGAFAVISFFEKEEHSTELKNLAGKGFKHPFLGFMMVIFMFSLAGVPPTSGFTGKFYIFTGAIQAGYVSLAIIGVLNSAISAYYYLRVLIYMYFKDAEEDVTAVNISAAQVVAIIISALGVLNIGILPGSVFDLTIKSISYLF